MTRSNCILILLGLALGAGPVLADRFEENSPAVVLNGNWQTVADANASGGAYAVSGTTGSTLTFTFTGDSLTIYRVMDRDGGQVSVTIDNVLKGSIHCYFPARRSQIPAVIERLGAGTHTVVLAVNATSPAGSSGTNFYFDAFETPQTFTPTAAQQAAIARLNLYRQQAGLPLAQLSAPMNLAAQGHAQYNLRTGVLSHDETAGTDDFIGAKVAQRLGYYGCWQGGAEDAAQLGNPLWAIDGWLASVYHRTPIMAYRRVDIGYGGATAPGTVKGMDVMDFGTKSGQSPAARVIATYPANRQTNVSTSWGISTEVPNPFPAGAQPPYGFPISLHIAQADGAAAGTGTAAGAGTLADANGKPVPVYYLDRNTDRSGFLTGDDYFMIPQQPLQPNATYRARISGADKLGNNFDTAWEFTTGPASAIGSILPFSLTAGDIWIQWLTDGAVTSTQVNFGTTTAYGATALGTPNDDTFTTQVVAHLTGLAPATTYHFQISATDAAGVVRTSEDATFTTPNQ